MMGSVLKCTEFCLCRRGKGVFAFGNVGIVVFNGLNFVSIQSSLQVACAGDFGKYVC